MHEIVTIQIGNQANYLGTHFWNAQESYFTYGGEGQSQIDHDVHFKAGIGADGSATYTPRTLIYDLKSNFGTLRQINALYETLENDQQSILDQRAGPWSSAAPSLLQHQAPIPPHNYQVDLNSGVAQPPRPTVESVRFWSDYNRVFYHPRSLVQIRSNATSLGAQLGSMEDWDTGTELFSSLQREDGETLFERDLRPLLEECDQLQGLQVITGVDDAWGGFAASLMEEVRDDMGKGVVWIWGCEDVRTKAYEKQIRHIANVAKSFQQLTSQASLYVPLANVATQSAPSYLKLDTASPWHTSALQATILESITLPSRLRSDNTSRASLAELETVFLGEARRNIVEAELSVKQSSVSPETNGTNGTVINDASTDVRMQNGYHTDLDDDLQIDPLEISLASAVPSSGTASLNAGTRRHIFATSHVQRGPWPAPWVTPDVAGYRDPAYLSRSKYASTQLFPQPTSYPDIFDFPAGSGDATMAGTETEDQSGLAVHVALSATTNVADRLRTLAGQVARIPLISRDDREDMYSDLKTLADEYVEGWDPDFDESGSEED